MDTEKELSSVNGEIEAVVFRNDENGYSVLKARLDDGTQATLVGCLPSLYPGETVSAYGEWENNSTHGLQFKVSLFQPNMPYSENAIFRFLSSGALKGVGPATATQIVDRFGLKALSVIADDSERLAEIRGITLQKARKINEEFVRHTGIQELMAYVCTYNLRPVLAMRIYRYYGERSLEMLQNNPYIIASSHIGGRFAEADRFALDTGIEGYSPDRIKAALIFELRHNMNNGHCFIPSAKLCAATAEMIGVDSEDVGKCLEEEIEESGIICEEIAGCRACYLPELYEAEKNVAEKLALRRNITAPIHPDLEKAIRRIENQRQICYTDDQRLTLSTALNGNITVITGGPGTGKTTVIDAIVHLFEELGLRTVLCAPTGKAAKRMTEVTGMEAYTVHRLLGARIAEDDETVLFDKNEEDPLKCDALILDECSMVDILLMNALIRALPDSSKLILVGDADQLPSVGPGNVFSSIIRSDVVPVVVLKRIFRQGEGSRIVENAHRINQGIMPDLSNNTGDFFRLKRVQPAAALDTICDLFSNRLPRRMQIPVSEIQVLSPTRKGELGTIRMNKILQERLNPGGDGKKEILFGETVFRENDKVMQIRNDYEVIWTDREGTVFGNGIYNGDTGVIEKIDPEAETMLIDFDGKLVLYGLESLIEIEHAWAITVHKSQGSEFKAVILALSANSSMLLTRDVLYTAVSRAKDLLILVGDDAVVARMVENYKQTKRYCGLRTRLVGLCAGKNG